MTRHAVLWRELERRGVVLGEAPLGAPPERWRFPARNRLIAALADIVVVVESQEQGGSMHTVNEAERRARPVFAVPGPVRSAASAGTNRLLRDGAQPACDVSDVLLGLGLSAALQRDVHASPTRTRGRASRTAPRPTVGIAVRKPLRSAYQRPMTVSFSHSEVGMFFWRSTDSTCWSRSGNRYVDMSALAVF